MRRNGVNDRISPCLMMSATVTAVSVKTPHRAASGLFPLRPLRPNRNSKPAIVPYCTARSKPLCNFQRQSRSACNCDWCASRSEWDTGHVEVDQPRTFSLVRTRPSPASVDGLVCTIASSRLPANLPKGEVNSFRAILALLIAERRTVDPVDPQCVAVSGKRGQKTACSCLSLQRTMKFQLNNK